MEESWRLAGFLGCTHLKLAYKVNVNFDLFNAFEITFDPKSSAGTFFKDLPIEPTAVLTAAVITMFDIWLT